MGKPNKKEPEKEIRWHEDQLIYRKLFLVEMKITECKYNLDWERLYILLKDEFVNVLENIRPFFEKDDMTEKDWEDRLNEIKKLLYDPRHGRSTIQSERLEMKNYSNAEEKLHEFNKLLNKYETKAGLRITMVDKEKLDADKAVMGMRKLHGE